jgi:hypothetical protein
MRAVGKPDSKWPERLRHHQVLNLFRIEHVSLYPFQRPDCQFNVLTFVLRRKNFKSARLIHLCATMNTVNQLRTISKNTQSKVAAELSRTRGLLRLAPDGSFPA